MHLKMGVCDGCSMLVFARRECRGGLVMAKRKTRMSGKELKYETGYTHKNEEGEVEVCIGKIQEYIDEYLKEAHESGKYSVAGLCIALGITRERLDAWRDGYFEAIDIHDEVVVCNEELATCIEMGLLHIERYWEECDKSSVQSKHVKMLERSGAFEEKKRKSIATPPFDLGKYNKFSK